MSAKLVILTTAALLGLSPPIDPAPAAPDDDQLVRISGQAVAYRAAGEFAVGDRPVPGPLLTGPVERPFSIMRRQVTRGDYAACVAAGACKALTGGGAADLPATGLNWHDATAYAAWRTAVTGAYWRLPTDREWAIAAGSRYRDDAPAPNTTEDGDPAQRWLAAYAEAARERGERDTAVHSGGHFGRNENGLDDVAGTVWEWTSTCFSRQRLDPATGQSATIENCGVRVTAGAHRAYMQTFFRDPKAGGCSVGVPPSHLGLRLVRDDGPPPRRETPSAADRLLGSL